MNPLLRRTLIALAGLAMLIVLFYAEEDCRGWLAWHHFKNKWEAKGIKLNYAGIVPPKVPDDQNFALSPVWIAEINLAWQKNPQWVASWYGNRTNDDVIAKLTPLLPVSVSGLTGDNSNASRMPPVPVSAGNWTDAKFTDLTPWQSYYRNLARINPSAAIPVSPRPQSPAADVLLALSKFDPVIERVRQDAALPDSRFPVIYTTDNPAEIMLPHLAMIKRYALVIQLRALAELQNNAPQQALADVKLILRLTEAIHTEPFIISHLVRIAMVNIAMQPVWEGTANHQWSDAQLAELDAELAKIDFLADFRLASQGEAGMQSGIIDFLRRHPAQFYDVFGDGKPHPMPLLKRVGWHLVPRGWYYQNQIYCARPMMEIVLPLSDTNRRSISPAASRKADTTIQAEIRHANGINFAEKILLYGPSAEARRFAYGQETVDLGRVAIALERFRIATGVYPTTLDPLEPRFIAQLPNDVINGEPLNYRQLPSSKYVLYSVGWNEKDDGGKVANAKSGMSDNLNGDWVWQN